MIATATRLAGAVGLLLAASAPAPAGPTPKEIDQAIQKGAAALKARYANGGAAAGGGAPGADHGLGGTCLSGLALMEAGLSPDDPAVKAIAAAVRDAAYKQHRTYQVALCLMFLDRLGDPADVPRIQMLAARLLVGQVAGGWDYECTAAPTAEMEAWLRANLRPQPGEAAKKWHPDADAYLKALVQARAGGAAGGPTAGTGGDNSNTQFAVIAVWMSRKYGAPVEPALEAVEQRFRTSQDLRTGNWPYSPVAGQNQSGSPSMYCAGLIAMATALARHEDKKKPEPKAVPKSDKPLDPFYNPPPPRDKDNKESKPVRANDPRNIVIQRAFTGLGLTMLDQARTRGLLFADGTGGHGTGDLYFLWSLERVGVVYGVDKIGGLDWYDLGAAAVIRAQGADGSWGTGGYGAEVNTAFAVLFLCRSNLARDLSSRVQKDPTSAEMRAGQGPGGADPVAARTGGGGAAGVVATPILDLPNPTGDAGVALASRMLRAQGSEWVKMLNEARDGKGATNTKALVMAATHADGPRKATARDALADRLWRMTPDTLRAMMRDSEPELRRAAAVACAMRNDKAHLPDLIALLTDPNDSVVRAAKAGLKSLTDKDFGPPATPTPDQKTAAAAEWRAWYAKEGKK